MLESLKKEVYKAHMNLWKNRLVMWTSGNVSARDPETNFVVIKPSGVSYEKLSPDNLAVVDLNGKAIEGQLRPSNPYTLHLCQCFCGYRQANSGLPYSYGGFLRQ
jgi:L-ribulose-5-phosphate 4-epimerase